MEDIVIGIVDDDPEYIELFIENVEETFANSEFNISLKQCVLDEDIENRVDETINAMFDMDIAVMDFSMPRYSGIDIMTMFAQRHEEKYGDVSITNPVPLFIMNTVHKDNVNLCRQAMKAGFSDFVTNPKTDPSLLMDLLVEYVHDRIKTKETISVFSEMMENGILL